MTDIWRRIAAAYADRSYYLIAAAGLLIIEAEPSSMVLVRRTEKHSA
jgi:hypothetical protein